MAHRTARLNAFGRQLLVTRIEIEGWPVADAAAAQGISRTTAHKWMRRYRDEGWAGLEDRSSRPHRGPRRLSARQERAVLRERVRRRWGPHRLGPLLEMPRSTVYAVLDRHGYGRLADADRVSGVPVRYVRERPGELIHQDHKKLGRVPPGGGHRIHGRAAAHNRHRGLGHDHFEVIVDDATRLAYVAHVPDESAASASRALLDAAVWFAERGVRIERVLTDNAKSYAKRRVYAATLDELGIGHRRTRPYRPQTNGKAERFIKTLLDEWAYGRRYRSNGQRLRALSRWVEYDNTERTHTALGGIPPMEALVNNLRGNHS